MHLFYTPGISPETEFYNLGKEESLHCSKVLRMQTGDNIYLIDGKGNFFEAQIIEISPKNTLLKVISYKKEYNKKSYTLQIGIAPTKNIDRFEFFLEKATEIGIDKITPLLCRYSERKIIKTDRLEKIIISAIKQSKKAYKPDLEELCNFEKIVSQEFPGQKFIAHCYNSPKGKLSNIYKPSTNVLVLIGPEGDFSQEEINIAVNNGFIPVSLSDSILRTETAGITACNIIQILNEL